MTDCSVHRLIADVVVVASGRVLFVRYRDTSSYDGQAGWFLPDDLLAHLEHPDDAARRILREQTGIDDADVRLGEIESFGNGRWHLAFHYVVSLEEPAIAAGETVAAAEWFATRSRRRRRSPITAGGSRCSNASCRCASPSRTRTY